MLANTIQVRNAIRKAAETVDGRVGTIWTNKSRTGGDLRFIGAEVGRDKAAHIAAEARTILENAGFCNRVYFTRAHAVGSWRNTLDYVRADAVLA